MGRNSKVVSLYKASFKISSGSESKRTRIRSGKLGSGVFAQGFLENDFGSRLRRNSKVVFLYKVSFKIISGSVKCNSNSIGPFNGSVPELP